MKQEKLDSIMGPRKMWPMDLSTFPQENKLLEAQRNIETVKKA